MAYTITTPQMGWVQIANTDSGILPPVATSSGSTTYIPTPPLVPGMIVEATDPTYGTLKDKGCYSTHWVIVLKSTGNVRLW